MHFDDAVNWKEKFRLNMVLKFHEILMFICLQKITNNAASSQILIVLVALNIDYCTAVSQWAKVHLNYLLNLGFFIRNTVIHICNYTGWS